MAAPRPGSTPPGLSSTGGAPTPDPSYQAPAGASPIPVVSLGSAPTTASNAGALNSVAASAQVRQAQVVAENAPIRLLYGRTMIGAQIADVLFYNGNLIIFAVWVQGPVNLIEAYYLDDMAPPGGVTAVHHDGTQVVADATLVAAYASVGITYTDILPGIAYSVITLPPGVTSGFPRVTAIIQGLKVYDPRSSTTVYSDNPSLALADLQSNTTYGAGGAVDWTSVIAAANANDALVGGVEKRRTIGLVLDQPQPINQWMEALRAYAGCFLARNGNLLTLIPDRPASSTRSFSETTGTGRISKVRKRSKRDVPTVSAVRYTDTSAIPWRDNIAYAFAAGVLAGTVPWKAREVAMPGVVRYTQAVREATEALNKLALTDLTFDVEGQDEALDTTVGDVITATANVGLSNRLARVLNVATPLLGRPVFSCEGYDASVYSDSVATAPTVVDTTLPNPNAPPTPVSLVLTEELFQVNADGLYFSRIKATFAAPASFPIGFIRNFRIEVSLAGAIINSGTPSTGEYRTPQIQEGNTYTVTVWLVSSTGAVSATPAVATILVTGNPAVPTDVANFTARAIGGRVFMAWTANPERDLSDYELRYGATNVWSAGTLITRTVALQLTTDPGAIPAGSWYFMAKARNKTRTGANPNGVYSANAASVLLALTLDTSLLVRASYNFTTPVLTNMTLYQVQGDATKYYITDFGDGVGFGADFPVDTVGTFGDSLVNRVLAVPHTSGGAQWQSEVYDYGQALFGDWNYAANLLALDGGAYVVTLDLKALIGDPWTPFTVFPARMSARYARLTISTVTTNAALVKMDPIGPAVTLDVAYKSESFTVTTSATLAVTVSLTGKYSLYKAIPLTAKGTAAKIATYNNVVLSPTGANSFDVYAFNDAGAQIAVEVSGIFQGI